jgi:hypothetical protein
MSPVLRVVMTAGHDDRTSPWWVAPEYREAYQHVELPDEVAAQDVDPDQGGESG